MLLYRTYIGNFVLKDVFRWTLSPRTKTNFGGYPIYIYSCQTTRGIEVLLSFNMDGIGFFCRWGLLYLKKIVEKYFFKCELHFCFWLSHWAMRHKKSREYIILYSTYIWDYCVLILMNICLHNFFLFTRVALHRDVPLYLKGPVDTTLVLKSNKQNKTYICFQH